MVSRDVLAGVLENMKGEPIVKSVLQGMLQSMLGTDNTFESGADNGEWYDTEYFTNGDTYSTHNFCDVAVDYLPTRNKGEIYVIGTEILDYKY